MRSITDKENFAQRLKRLRKQAGLNQEELAHETEFSIMTIRRWEWGERTPRLEEIQKLAKALHVSEDELLNGTPDSNNTWVLTVQISHTEEELIDLKRLTAKPLSTIITKTQSAFLELGGSYDLWTDDQLFNKMIADFKKLRATVIQNGIALGGIKQN